MKRKLQVRVARSPDCSNSTVHRDVAVSHEVDFTACDRRMCRPDAVIVGRIIEVLQDGRPIGDGLGLGPRPEGEAQSEHVTVRSDAGIAEQIPGSAEGLATFEDGVGLAGAFSLQVEGGVDARQAGAHD